MVGAIQFNKLGLLIFGGDVVECRLMLRPFMDRYFNNREREAELERQYEAAASVAHEWATIKKSETLLFITHALGGGIGRHINDLKTLVHLAGGALIIGQPSPEGHLALRMIQDHQDKTFAINPEWGRIKGAELLRNIPVTHMHVHSLVGYPDTIVDTIMQLCSSLGVSYDFTFHDYMTICPRIHMFDANNMYCGEPNPEDCDQCIIRNGSPFGQVPIAPWRERHERLLLGARAVFAPNSDVATRVRRYFPEVNGIVRPHLEITSQPLRIALIGHLVGHKGSGVVAATARAAQRANLPLRFIILGKTDDDAGFAALDNVELRGEYRERDLDELLRAVKPDLVWFASTVPETYNYTLSTAIRAGLPCLAFDIGAIAARILEHAAGNVMPLSYANNPFAIIRELVTVKQFIHEDASFLLSNYYTLDNERATRRFFQDPDDLGVGADLRPGSPPV